MRLNTTSLHCTLGICSLTVDWLACKNWAREPRPDRDWQHRNPHTIFRSSKRRSLQPTTQEPPPSTMAVKTVPKTTLDPKSPEETKKVVTDFKPIDAAPMAEEKEADKENAPKVVQPLAVTPTADKTSSSPPEEKNTESSPSKKRESSEAEPEGQPVAKKAAVEETVVNEDEKVAADSNDSESHKDIASSTTTITSTSDDNVVVEENASPQAEVPADDTMPLCTQAAAASE